MSPISSPCGLTITNAWSIAGVTSFVHIKGTAKENFLFDCGSIDTVSTTAKYVFCTHGHMDHIGACVAHARARALSSSAATYYVPPGCLTGLQEAKSAFEKLDGSDIPMKIVVISPGESVSIGRLRFFAFETDHRVESQGYAVFAKSSPSLLPQYTGLSGAELGKLRMSGVNIHSQPEEKLELVYTGDTTFAGLMKPACSFIFQAPILITELTYLDGEYAKAIKWGHIHIDDIVQNCHLFENNRYVVFVHLSAKYHVFSRALMMLRNRLPKHVIGSDSPDPSGSNIRVNSSASVEMATASIDVSSLEVSSTTTSNTVPTTPTNSRGSLSTSTVTSTVPKTESLGSKCYVGLKAFGSMDVLTPLYQYHAPRLLRQDQQGYGSRSHFAHANRGYSSNGSGGSSADVSSSSNHTSDMGNHSVGWGWAKPSHHFHKHQGHIARNTHPGLVQPGSVSTSRHRHVSMSSDRAGHSKRSKSK